MRAFAPRWALLALAFAATTGAQAGLVWDGGGADTNLNTPNNWDDNAVPDLGGSANVVFGTAGSTATINTSAGFNSILFNRDAAFNLAAGAGTLTLGAGGLTAQTPSATARVYTIAEDLTLATDQSWLVTNNTGAATLAVSGSISDGASSFGITKSGNGTLRLAGNNSYDGATVVKKGVIELQHSNALGSTAGSTSIENGGAILVNGSVAIPEAITTLGEGVNGTIQSSGGSNTFSGPITISAGTHARFYATGGATLTFSGGISGPTFSSWFLPNPSGGSTLRIIDNPIKINTGYMYIDWGGGTLVLGVKSNVWGNTALTQAVTVRTDVSDALPTNTEINASGACTLNLNGNDQVVRSIFSTADQVGATVYSATPATLTVNQTANKLFAGRFTGVASLIKNGNNTLSLTNASTSTGSMIVSNGTLELLTQTCIADTATLKIADGGGAKVKIAAGLNETVDKLFFGETQKNAGTYGPTGSGAANIDDVHFDTSATGMITVQSSPPVVVTGATWDAGGGDTLIDTAANWVGDATPNLTGGNTHAIFGMGGSLATLNQNVSLHGIVLNRGADFTVTNTAAETLTLGASGISAVLPDANSRTYTLATPVTLSANQNWGITNNGAGVATLAVSGNLDDGILSFGIVKSGSGILTLSGSNSYDGVTLVQTGGIARIKSNWALGSTNGLTRIENGAWLEVSGGVTVEEPIEISGDAASQYAGALRATGGSNTWSGSITVPAGTGSRIGATGPDTFLDIAGGLYLNGGMALQNAAPVRFVNKPIVANPWWNGIYFHGGGLTIVAVTNNDFGAIDVRSGTMRMDTANAFTTRLRLSISPNGTFDLNGNSQIVGELHSGEPANATIHTLTSAQPATLTITAADNDRVYAGRLTGAVGLVKNGGKILIVSNAVNSTTGDMVVNAGTLTVAPTSSLGSGTNVTVTGGTLALQTSTGIADSATLTIADGGGAKVNVAAGQTETVGWLVLGDKGKASGTWGASGSGAANLDDVHFAGGGKINVLHGLNCTLIAIR